MGKRYGEEFKEEAVRLARSGERPVNRIAEELGVSRTALRTWMVEGSSVMPTGETKEEELQRLRRENRTLQLERDILKKATAFFAKESR